MLGEARHFAQDTVVVRGEAECLHDALAPSAGSAAKIAPVGLPPVVRLDQLLRLNRHQMRGPPGVVRQNLARGVRVPVWILRRTEIRADVRRDAITRARDAPGPAAVAEPPEAPVPLRRIRKAELAADVRLWRRTQHKRHAQAALAVIDGGNLAIRDCDPLQAFKSARDLGFQIGRIFDFWGGVRNGRTGACRHREGECESDKSVSCQFHCGRITFLVRNYTIAPF